MGIIDGVKRAVTTAAENIKKATQAKAKEAQERRQSSGAKDKAEISSQAQEVGSKSRRRSTRAPLRSLWSSAASS